MYFNRNHRVDATRAAWLSLPLRSMPYWKIAPCESTSPTPPIIAGNKPRHGRLVGVFPHAAGQVLGPIVSAPTAFIDARLCPGRLDGRGRRDVLCGSICDDIPTGGSSADLTFIAENQDICHVEGGRNNLNGETRNECRDILARMVA
jgi:hypothetical protein